MVNTLFTMRDLSRTGPIPTAARLLALGLASAACGAPVDEGVRDYSVKTVAAGHAGTSAAGQGGVGGGVGHAGASAAGQGGVGGVGHAGASSGGSNSGGGGGASGGGGSNNGGSNGGGGGAKGGGAGLGGGPAAGGATSGSAGTSSSAGAPASDSPPTKRVLSFTWKGQETYYWCGPGSTRMALSTNMASPPSQTQLASYMGTTENGTDHVGLVAGALNHWLATSWFSSKSISDPPGPGQEAQLKKDIVSNVGKKGYPLVANVISGWRPPGYPGGTIYHYVAIVGYDAAGDEVLIADPAGAGAGGASWGNVPQSYWVSIHDLAVWIGGKGYAGLARTETERAPRSLVARRAVQ